MDKKEKASDKIPYTLDLANAGDSNAQYWMGAYYYKGDGVKRDLRESENWFRKSAVAGNHNAQYHLGVNFRNILDVSESAHWVEVAAKNGNLDAQRFLSSLYFGGFFLRKDEEEANRTGSLETFRKGRAEAQRIYKIEALKWITVANHRKPNVKTKILSLVMKICSGASERDEARRLAVEWEKSRG